MAERLSPFIPALIKRKEIGQVLVIKRMEVDVAGERLRVAEGNQDNEATITK